MTDDSQRRTSLSVEHHDYQELHQQPESNSNNSNSNSPGKFQCPSRCTPALIVSFLALVVSSIALFIALHPTAPTAADNPTLSPSPSPSSWPPENEWLVTCAQSNYQKFETEKKARDTFYAKMERCRKGGLYNWGFGSLLNSFSIPARADDLHPYNIKGLERGWAKAGPTSMEIQALNIVPNPLHATTGGFSSHQRYLNDKPGWADEMWCREVTEGNLVFEFVYVPEQLKDLMSGQKFFQYDSTTSPPSAQLQGKKLSLTMNMNMIKQIYIF